MKTLLTAVAGLAILVSTSMAAPFSNSIQLPQNIMGTASCRPQPNVSYNVSYDSPFGGHWELTGKRHVDNRQGTYTDTFRGTISDTAVQATFGPSSFGWTSDWYWLCNHGYAQCISFSMTIADGSVTGFATYSP
jgi:hypothetical protein